MRGIYELLTQTILINMSTEKKSTSESAIGTPIDLNIELPSFSDLLPDALQPYWQFIQQYPMVEWLSIVGVFWLLAFLIRRFAVSLMQSLTAKTKNSLDDNVINSLRPPLFSIVIWLGVIIATQSANFTHSLAEYIPLAALSFITLSVLRAALKISSLIITAAARDQSRFMTLDIRTEPLAIISSKIILLLIGCYLVLAIWGINPVGLLASAGIVGIAVGFAAKDTLSNLFSGVFILVDRPYKLGDMVNLDSGERGQITHIGIRSTRIMTRDDLEITIPNGLIGNQKVVNESGGDYQKMRVRIRLQCAYEANLDKVVEVLMAVAIDEPGICAHPLPRVRIKEFAESGINLQIQAWIDRPQDRGRIMHSTFIAIHKAFDKEGLEIPYAKRELHITKEGEQAAEPIYQHSD